MRQEIIARQRKIMAENGLDALIAVSPENYAWTTGFVVPSQPILRWRHAIVVVKADGTHAVVSVDMEETTVRNRLPGVEVRVWGEFEFNAMQTLASLSPTWGWRTRKSGPSWITCRRATSTRCARPCRTRSSARPSSCSRVRVSSRRRRKSRCCASSRASRIPQSRMPSRRCRRGAANSTSPRR